MKSLLSCNTRKQRTRYDEAFKENAVKIGLDRKNVSDLSRELGISPALLFRWRKEFQEKEEGSFLGNGVRFQGGDADRVTDFEKRLKEAETERDMQKKL